MTRRCNARDDRKPVFRTAFVYEFQVIFMPGPTPGAMADSITVNPHGCVTDCLRLDRNRRLALCPFQVVLAKIANVLLRASAWRVRLAGLGRFAGV